MSAPSLALRRLETPAGRGALVRLEGLAPAGPVLVLVDASGSLAGGPLGGAAAFAAGLLEALDPARLAGVIALGGSPGLLGPLQAPRLLPTAPGLLARAGSRARADLAAAARLARAELARVQGAGLTGVDLVLVSDLLLEPTALAAWRELGRDGARLHAARVPIHLPDPPAAPPDLVLEPGQEARQGAALATRLAGPPAGRLRLRLEAPPRRFFLGEPGRWRRGAPATSPELALDRLSPGLGFVAPGPLRGELELQLAGSEPVRATLDPAGLEPLEPALAGELAALLAEGAAS